MKTFDFATPQETLAQVQASGQKAIEASEKFFSAQMALIQENTRSAFALARSAMEVRDAEGLKSFGSEASRATREAFERNSQFVQSLVSDQAAAVQELGKTGSRKR